MTAFRRSFWVLSAFLLLSSWPLQAEEITANGFQAGREKAMEQAVLKFLKETPSETSAAGIKIESDVSTVEILNLQLGSSLKLNGEKITRFVVTSPDVVSIEQGSPASLTVTGKTLGATLLHLWDEGHRRSFKIQVTRKLGEQEIAEVIPTVKHGQKAPPFKLRYQLNHNAFYRGKSLSDASRSSLNVTHRIEGLGETPYGNFSYKTSLRKNGKNLDVSNYTLELKNGRIGEFQDFDFSLFDTSFSGTRYTLPTTLVTGTQLTQRLDSFSYDAFWGQERFGVFGTLAPGFEKKNDSYLTGLQLNRYYDQGSAKGVYGHGYGSDRNSKLPNDVVGFSFEQTRVPLAWNGDVGSDGSHYGLRFTNRWKSQPWKLETTYRDVQKDYFTLVGTTAEQGERGVNFSANYDPVNAFHLGGNLDLYRNFLFPNAAEPGALNALFGLDLSTAFWESYSFRVSYSESRLLGSLSPSESKRYGASVGHYFKIWGRSLNTYLRYQFRDYVSRPTPSSDYKSHQIVLGGNARLTGNLSLNTSEEWSLVDETSVNVQTRPRAFSAGIDYKIPVPKKIPLSATYGVRVRNEENTQSSRSFLSGEDTLTHSLDMTYRLANEKELFLNGSLEKILFESDKHRQVEGNVFMGVRSSFDTPLRWNPRSSIVGVVYEDKNQNGRHDSGEKGFEGITVLCEEKRTTTDNEGYYLMDGVIGKTALVSLDISSLPHGYVTTGITEKEVPIIQGQPVLLNFGILSIAQIRGFIFNDLNADHTFDLNDLGIEGITVWLDDQESTKSDRYGHFTFGKVEAGKHFLRVDLKDLPYTYLTDVPLKQEITLEEAESYEHFFPLKTVKIIGGRVFYDANQNGSYDAGEEGIARVKITVGRASATTDRQGSYLVEEVPVGAAEVEINEETLPQPYRLTSPKQRVVGIRPEGTLAQDVDFAVTK